jgi:thiamine biosynthesis lipoprotein
LDKVEFSQPQRTSGEGSEGLGVRFAIAGMRLDLGGIAKGYIAQRAAEVLQRRGISSAMIDTGGNIYCLGTRPDGEPWRIGIRDPRGVEGDEAEILLRISLEDQAVSTSAHYYRFFKIGRQRFSHIINPRTGWPVQETDLSPSGSEGPVSQSVASVTVVGPDAGLCDGYSTAIAVMGAESGVKMIDKLPSYECYVVTEDAEGNLVERRSRGFAALQARP